MTATKEIHIFAVTYRGDSTNRDTLQIQESAREAQEVASILSSLTLTVSTNGQLRPGILALTALLTFQIPNEGHAQALDIKTFPFLEMILPHQITSSSDGMGLLEFAVDDLVRNSFTNPAKSVLLDRDWVLLSGTAASYQIKTHDVTSGVGGSESSRDERASKSVLPIGGMYRFGAVRIGGMASCLGSTSYAKNRQTGTGPPTSFDLDLKGSGYPFDVILGISAADSIGIGVAYGRSDIKTSGSLAFSNQSRQRKQSTVGSHYKLGMVYAGDQAIRLSIVGIRYESSDNLSDTQTGSPSSSHAEEIRGWAVQGEGRKVIEEIGTVSLRATADFKELNERSATGSATDSESKSEATVLQLGLGAARTEGILMIAGEILIEPAWMTTKTPPGAGSSLTTDWKFSNWRTRLGVSLRITTWLTWGGGVEYLSFRNTSFQMSSATSTNVESNPYASHGRTTLTTGVDGQIGPVRILYNFLYRSDTYTGLLAAPSNSFNFFAPLEVKPLTHRINVTYEFE